MRYCIRPDDHCCELTGFLKRLEANMPTADLDDVRIVRVEVDLSEHTWTIHLNKVLDESILAALSDLHQYIPGVRRVAFCCEDQEPAEDTYMLTVMQQFARMQEEAASNGNGSIQANNTDVIKGRKIAQKPISMEELSEPGESAVVTGELLSLDCRTIRRGGSLLIMDFTDYTDSITAKIFVDDADQLSEKLVQGEWYTLRGDLEIDRYSEELCLMVRDISRARASVVEDNAPHKRVELHLHSRMSAMDSVVDLQGAIGLAAQWGHPAVAITDHGCVQAFPEAYKAGKKHGIKIIYGLEGYLTDSEDQSAPTYHIIILAKNEQGLQHLYELVSLSHIDYFYRHPRIPRHELDKRREGLILGSACEAGELMRALINRVPVDEARKIASYYDFLEIQPLGNNEFLIGSQGISTEQGLIDLNMAVVRLGDELGLPVVATGDVHFLRPADEVYRRILMVGQGYSDAERQAPLYLRTTEEMLEEFVYLGDRKEEIVIDNPRRIAEGIEELRPFPAGLHTPKIPEAEELVPKMSYENATSLYGDELPELVAKRLERELKAIVGNGYAALYWIAHKLTRKSLDQGYLVGSRGSVGSSFVATMCSITEVNPLPPHYRCPHCKYSHFITDGSVACGVDLPLQDCPECGTALERDGFDIPFEVFLGFEGDKVPDIDLNFSGECQSLIHAYTEELFGKDHVFRAGTISTLAERTAYGFVKNYLDSRGHTARNAEINRLVRGCSGVRRTTGQHPGGMVVIPEGRNVHEFTPVQYPANDRNSGTITTHFDFHAIDETLVKLDILGHDDPTVLRMLQDMTGVNALEIPLDDPATMSIFSRVDALKVVPEDIGDDVGTIGVPEFGTRFVRGMLRETRPETFGDLVRISGFSHGTDVWANNAQELIKNQVATLNEAIATRDDIMLYLIQKGLPAKHAFAIMERVRKGRGLRPEDIEAMKAQKVPQWYIDSCEKISYMFPKAHAVAYVMMSFRIAYFKVHHPDAFYAAYFTTRVDEFDADLVLAGTEKMRQFIKRVEDNWNDATARDKSVMGMLEVALEAMVRGIRFLPVDLYHSDVSKFIIAEPNTLLPPLIGLQGLGRSAAENIVQARKQPFRSIEDLKDRTGASKTVIDALGQHGCLQGLPPTDQMQLF
ncbi:MAG: PolC-type DNA polymerase III [Limnochordia bacterium]|nr:PolC-type DNA polymerase III [Limnochordia bacterium]